MRNVLLAYFADGLPTCLHSSDGRLYLPPAQVVELSQVEQHTYAAHCKHEDQEHCLFRGPRHVALHLLHAWVAIALEHPRHVEAVQEVLASQEADLQSVAEDHLDDIEAGDAFLSPHLGTFVSGREATRPVGDLLYLQAVMVLLAAVGMH